MTAVDEREIAEEVSLRRDSNFCVAWHDPNAGSELVLERDLHEGALFGDSPKLFFNALRQWCNATLEWIELMHFAECGNRLERCRQIIATELEYVRAAFAVVDRHLVPVLGSGASVLSR